MSEPWKSEEERLAYEREHCTAPGRELPANTLHRCTACGCLWRRWMKDGAWSLADANQRACARCDNSPEFVSLLDPPWFPAKLIASRPSPAGEWPSDHKVGYMQWKWRTNPPPYAPTVEWRIECIAAIIDALAMGGIKAWSGDGTDCVAQIVDAYAKQTRTPPMGWPSEEQIAQAIYEAHWGRGSWPKPGGGIVSRNQTLRQARAVLNLLAAAPPAPTESEVMRHTETWNNDKSGSVRPDIAQPRSVREAGATAQERMRRLKERIDICLNDYLCEMKPDCDDSIIGFNEAWDIVRKIFADELSFLPHEGGGK